MAQFGVVPTQPTSELYQGRPVIHYKLQPIISEVTEAFDQEAIDLAVSLTGGLWIDDEPGALLKSEISCMMAAPGNKRKNISSR